MDFLKNPDDEDMFPYWGAGAQADLEDVNYLQFFITPREEQLMQTPLTSLVSDLSSSQLVGALAAQPVGVDSNFSGAFKPWLLNKSSIDVCEDQRGKCTRKRMLSWIMDLWHQERKMKLTKTSSSDADAGSAPAPPEQTVPKVEQFQRVVQEQAYQIPPLIQTKVASHNHMIAERNRRLRERELKTVLMSCIPAGNMKKKDKNSVYQYAIEYIKQLQHHIGVLQQQQQSSVIKEPGQEASSSGLDEEVNKSCETSLHSMTPQEDGSTIRLSFDTSSRKMQPSLSAIIDMLHCLRGLGFEVGSINWKPETSSILAVTVHSTMNSSPVSAGQLRETLEQKLFPTRSFAA